MANHSIGQFIAALRKASGMTQQEVADRLNVSNKAVSRWERDECSPDLSVIPALAELFGITCDELLRGQRSREAEAPERPAQKADKQLRYLISRTLSAFKTMIWISLAVAAVGLICMFGISYSFYLPELGFAVMLLLETCAVTLAVLALNRARDAREGSELFEMADRQQVRSFDNTLGSLSFLAFFAVFASVLLSAPLLLGETGFANSVLTLRSYVTVFLGCIVLILLLVWGKVRPRYMARICGAPFPTPSADPLQRRLNLLQLGLIALASLLFIYAPYFASLEAPGTYIVLCNIGLGLLAISLVGGLVLYIIYKRCLLTMLRNLCLLPVALYLSAWHTPYYVNDQRYDYWTTDNLLYAIAWFTAVTLIFTALELLLRHRRKANSQENGEASA